MSQPLSTAGHVEGRARTNKHYADAVRAVPGYLEALALRDKAQARKRDILFPAVAWPSAPAHVDDLDAYLAEYTAAFEEEQTRARDTAALDTVVGACERQMRTVIDNPDALLTVLAADLDQLMTQVRNVVSRLNGATNPTEAIDNDTVDAWKELPALRREYDSVRHAQTFVLLDDPAMNHRSDHLDDPLASDVIIRNLDEVLPSWRDPDTRFAMQGTPPDRRPWPESSVEQLVWLINSGAEVWLPTAGQLAKLHTERRHRIDPPADGEPGNLMSDYGTQKWGLTKPRPAPVIR
jgi:hypothetical protein